MAARQIVVPYHSFLDCKGNKIDESSTMQVTVVTVGFTKKGGDLRQLSFNNIPVVADRLEPRALS